MLAFLFRSLVINFPFIHWIKTLYKCLTFPFFIPFKKGIKTLHKSLVFLLKDAFKIFLLSKELKPFIKVTISLYRIPFIKGIEILYKGLAFPQKFVNFYSVTVESHINFTNCLSLIHQTHFVWVDTLHCKNWQIYEGKRDF